MILAGTIQQTPAAGDSHLPMDDLTAEADDYDQAYTALVDRIPTGSRLIAARRD